MERALGVARDELLRTVDHDTGAEPRPADVSWADALVAVAEGSLAAEAVARPHRDRHLVLVHVRHDAANLHPGPGLSPGLRRFGWAATPGFGRCSSRPGGR